MNRPQRTSLALALGACQPTRADRVWSGAHVTVTSREGVELCGGSIDFFDAYVVHVSEYWGADDRTEPFSLELRESGEEDVSGRAGADGAWAGAEQSVLHELGHVVTISEDGVSAASLSEGFAAALDPIDRAGMWGIGSGPPEAFAFLQRPEFEDRHYLPSAQLARFLIQRYGIETYRRAYVEARADHSAERIEAAFVAVFGDEIYDAFDAFETGPQCGLRAWECEPALHPLLELPVDVQSPQDCTQDPEWVGAAPGGGEHWYPHRRFLLQVEADTEVVTVAENARLSRSTCADVCPSLSVLAPGFEAMAAPASSGAVPVRTLTAGLHAFHLTPVEPSLPFSVRMERALNVRDARRFEELNARR